MYDYKNNNIFCTLGTCHSVFIHALFMLYCCRTHRFSQKTSLQTSVPCYYCASFLLTMSYAQDPKPGPNTAGFPAFQHQADCPMHKTQILIQIQQDFPPSNTRLIVLCTRTNSRSNTAGFPAFQHQADGKLPGSCHAASAQKGEN